MLTSGLPRVIVVAVALGSATMTSAAAREGTGADEAAARSGSTISFLGTPAAPSAALPRCNMPDFVGDLFTIGADGSGRRRVAHDVGATSGPLRPGRGTFSWSPGGRRIAYESHADDDIYVVNTTDGRRHNLTRSARYDGVPAWSPDGRKIVFESWRDGTYEIYVTNADGTRRRRLTRNRLFDGAPAWSPDGRRIAFLRSSARERAMTIQIMDADGRSQRSLHTPGADGRPPTWSPDGRKILFSSGFELFVVDAVDGRRQRNVTNRPGDDVAPAWSPDGRRIVFEHHDERGSSDVYVANADGGESRRVARDGRQPTWAPDGRTIAYAGVAGGTTDIFVVNADGTRRRNVTASPGTCESSPSWAPAAKR